MSLKHIRSVSLRKQCGFSMVEILISFIVLAAGLLGIASIQKKGVDNNHAAYLRTQAVSLAQDMSSRVRANAAGFEGGSYDKPDATYNANCLGSGCTFGELANHDNFEWESELSLVLPVGEGIICFDSSPDDGDNKASPACDGLGTELVIKIWWDLLPKDGKVDQRYAIPFSI